MVALVNRKNAFFDRELAREMFEENKDELEDVNGFATLSDTDSFWNAYDKGEYIGSVFVYFDGEKNRLAGYGIRKRFRQIIEAIRMVSERYEELWADTQHRHAIVALLKAGWEIKEQDKRTTLHWSKK